MSLPPRLPASGDAQTAHVDSDWLKQLKHFTAGRFVLAEIKQLLKLLFQFRFSFISIVRTALRLYTR